MEKLLSIAIPTYNRAKYLDECLSYLVPQIRKRENEIEIIICDNTSTDNTSEIIDKYRKIINVLTYIINEKNLGYVGNQIRCLESASGKYISILCDDDIFRDGLIDKIIEVTFKKEYAFIALNYYSFYRNSERQIKKEFAPEKDVEFARAFDILNYPSVGHFSGFVFNAKLAKNAIKEALSKHALEYFEKHRGILFDVAVRSTILSDLPSFFIGKRLLAARIPEIVDYDLLYHQCLYYYEYHLSIFNKGLTKSSDLEYRAKIVLNKLPRAIISNAPFLRNEEINRITEIFSSYFKGCNRYDNLCYPLLKAVKYNLVKFIFKTLKILIKTLKRVMGWMRNLLNLLFACGYAIALAFLGD